MKHDLTACLIFQDQLMLILNKPPGIAVHAGPSGGESLEDYFEDLKFDYKETPRLAHRLDRDTSGCLILGRNDRALKKLGKLFESGKIQKTYWAITHGVPKEIEGTISTPLKKIKLAKGWSMKTAKKGEKDAQEAVTDYKVMKELPGNRAWVECYPRTGRTHQIRVHLQSIGCTIVNDWLYGPNAERPNTFPALCLHARRIEIPIYHDRPPVVVTAPPPEHMQECV